MDDCLVKFYYCCKLGLNKGLTFKYFLNCFDIMNKDEQEVARKWDMPELFKYIANRKK